MSETQQIQVDFRIPENLPVTLPVIPLRHGAMLPGAVVPLSVARARTLAAVDAANAAGRDASRKGLVLVAIQREPVAEPGPGDLLPVATLGRIVDFGRPAGRPPFVVVQGLCRVTLGGPLQLEPYMTASFTRDESEWPEGPVAEGVLRALRADTRQSDELLGGNERVTGLLNLALPTVLWLDVLASALDTSVEWRRDYLHTADPLSRADQVHRQLRYAREVSGAQKAVQQRMVNEAKDQQKEHLLRNQMKAIQEELGEKDSDLDELKARLRARSLPPEVKRVVDRELGRLDRLRDGSPERSVAIDWLEWMADMPWSVYTAHRDGETGEAVDLGALEAALDRSHYGLGDVKRQVVEHLAVRSLAGSGRADVLLLVGPPGVGKTSIGAAIAEATKRKLVRVALGGVRDEAELRGHRRTYIGARPGRLIEGIRRAAAADPVVLLDEIDKLGRGWQGDPSAALLEILDPEQNHAFTDHYLEVPFDLGKVLFIATANDLSQVPEPLRDRMEIIHIDGYTLDDKARIAAEHLLSKLAENAGISPGDVVLTDAALRAAISGWTREAGVRGLQRALGRVYRAAAVKKAKGELHEPLRVDVGDLGQYLGKRRVQEEEQLNQEPQRLPGVATGLAWTPVGGDVLHIEAATLPGKGQLVLTGQLGDVMKESARAALTYVLSHAAELGIAEDALAHRDVHIHVPAGAVPKDGPSAGVTMFTALASLLTGRPVRADTAMTGEATLRGRVLPVGGIQSKVLAAHRLGIRRVILPRKNAVDVSDIPEKVREELEIILVDHMDEVIAAALSPAREE